MNTDLLYSKSFEDWRDSMSSNGYSFFDENEIINKSDNPCYISENANSLEDIQSYQDMLKEAQEWLNGETGQEYLKEVDNVTANDIVLAFLQNDDCWLFFYTYLDELSCQTIY